MNHLKSAFRDLRLLVVLATLCISSPIAPMAQAYFPSTSSGTVDPKLDEPYILVGGQNGTWFRSNQWPKLDQIFLSNYSVTNISVTSEAGAVWTGAWNGSQWLISGFGSDSSAPNASNPFIYLYDGRSQIAAGTQDLATQQASLTGGDIFAASYNGTYWLVSGLGSGSRYNETVNQMALGLFDGYKFIDRSSDIPNQWDAVLFANAWNGQYWLVGGGWEGNEGVLFRYDGRTVTDLSFQLDSIVKQFNSVQAIGWNGAYWLIGGVGFLVKYDGRNFIDLSPDINRAMNSRTPLQYDQCCNSVNTIAWNGSLWMIGGGAPVAVPQPLAAWVTSYRDNTFTDFTSLLPKSVTNSPENSSILSIASVGDSWFFGGYANDHGMLLDYENSAITDISSLIDSGMSTVNWVGGWATSIFRASTPQAGLARLLSQVILVIVSITVAGSVGVVVWRTRHPRDTS